MHGTEVTIIIISLLVSPWPILYKQNWAFCKKHRDLPHSRFPPRFHPLLHVQVLQLRKCTAAFATTCNLLGCYLVFTRSQLAAVVWSSDFQTRSMTRIHWHGLYFKKIYIYIFNFCSSACEERNGSFSLLNSLSWFVFSMAVSPGCTSESLWGCLNIQKPKASLPEILSL